MIIPMKFLLAGINAKYIHTNPAIYSLRSYAGEKLQPFVDVAEYTINNKMSEILGDLYRRNPGVLGISCYIWNIELVKELIREIPKVLPETAIWLGGPEVSFEAEKLLAEYPMIKGIMTGEGEETFRDLLSYYAGNGNPEIGSNYHRLQDIPGLVLKEGATGARRLVNLDELPFIYEDLSGFENKIVYYESSRGCPYRCSYCLSSIDKRVRLRGMEKIKKELQFFLDNRVPQVKLIDRTFNCNKEHAMEIWHYIREHDNGITNFHFEVAADIIDEQELALLAKMRPGLVQLEIGVQTTNWKTLKEINRSADIAQIARVVDRIHTSGNIHVHLDLIAGLPFEGFDSFRKSFNDVYAMEPEQLQLGFLKVLKGTAIWEKAAEYGIVYEEKAPYEVLSTKWLSFGEVLQLKKVEEMVEIYYNSNQFTHTLHALEREFPDAFSMYEQLAAFYDEKGYFVNVPARSRRYEVLLEYVTEKLPEREALFKELLTFDYYLRENAKSRPSFACDLSPYHDRIGEFYQREEEAPALLKSYAGYHAKQMMKMTHMEVFFYPVWEKELSLEAGREKQPQLVLFDYQQKNPVTKEAFHTKI